MSTFPTAGGRSGPLKIFVVEDHQDTGKYLCMYLEALGHKATRVRNMAQALEELPHSDCDMLICDIRLPDGNGWDLLRALKERLSRPIYAIAVSSGVATSDRRKSKEAGFRHHLDKPFFPLVVEAHLKQAALEMAEQAQ